MGRSLLVGVWCAVAFLCLFLPLGAGLPLSFALLMLFYSFAPARKSSRAFRFGKWLSRSVLKQKEPSKFRIVKIGKTKVAVPAYIPDDDPDLQRELAEHRKIAKQARISGARYDQMNTKLALGLIVLTAIGTYELSHAPRHHFEPTKLENGSILIDTETGVECSARSVMKWTDEDKKAVEDGKRATEQAEKQFEALGHGATPDPCEANKGPEYKECAGLYDAEAKALEDYDDVLTKAKFDAAPRSAFEGFPLCKDIH